LVWDFSRAAPEKMKQQIYTVLDYEIRHNLNSETLRTHLVTLRKFYDYCTAEKIEYLELEPVERFIDTAISAMPTRK